MANLDQARPVAVVGAGSIGVAFAVVFARSGRSVRVWDPDPERLVQAGADTRERLELLRSHGLLDEPVDVALRRVAFEAALADAVADASLVQECGPESLEVKRGIFRDLRAAAASDALLASSSSALVPSAYGEGLDCADRILGAHPGNPPYLLPVIELIPSPSTSAAVLESAREQYAAAGLRPVLVRREVEGFLFNRLQGAVLREAYCLIRDGVASVEDIDEVVRSGLGLRWSFMGPFETVDLNTRGGIEAHAARMGPAYERMGAERGQHDPWTPELVAEVARQRREQLAPDDWERRVLWRDEQLMRLRTREVEGAGTAQGPPARP